MQGQCQATLSFPIVRLDTWMHVTKWRAHGPNGRLIQRAAAPHCPLNRPWNGCPPAPAWQPAGHLSAPEILGHLSYHGGDPSPLYSQPTQISHAARAARAACMHRSRSAAAVTQLQPRSRYSRCIARCDSSLGRCPRQKAESIAESLASARSARSAPLVSDALVEHRHVTSRPDLIDTRGSSASVYAADLSWQPLRGPVTSTSTAVLIVACIHVCSSSAGFPEV